MSKNINFIADPIAEYLKVYGFNHNPFVLSSAEDELIFQNDVADHKRSADRFFNYFVPFEDEILRKLIKETQGVILGSQGSGKTTLRFNLEAEIRSQYTDSLVSTLVLSKETDISNARAFWMLLSEALATDLIVQVIENFLFHEKILKDFVGLLLELKEFVALFRLERNLKIISKRIQNNYPLHIWPLLNRPVINHIRFSNEKVERLSLLWHNINRVDVSTIDYKEVSRELLRLMFKFGYSKLYLNLDFASDIPLTFLKGSLFQLELMLSSIFTIRPQYPQVFSKWFLPNSVELPPDSSFLNNKEQIHIHWTSERLRHLIANRFKSAQSYRRTVGELSEDKIHRWIDMQLVSNYNSPRDLLKVIQALLAAHIQNTYPLSVAEARINLTAQDWDSMMELKGGIY